MTDEVPPYVRFLAAAIEATVDDLVARELIELEEEKRIPLISELIAKAAEAETPRRMHKALRRGIVDSEHVAEIFGTDDQIQDLFRRHIER